MGQNIVFIQSMYSIDLSLLLTTCDHPMYNIRELQHAYLKETFSAEDEIVFSLCDKLIDCRHNDGHSVLDYQECKDLLNHLLTT